MKEIKPTTYLFFDTETTGLPKSWSAPLADPENWPRLVQLAWLLYDSKGNRLAGNTHIIKPEGFEIPEKASAIHGITTERALSQGEALRDVLVGFHTIVASADLLVGHNLDFDTKIVGAEFMRADLPRITPPRPRVCTMKSSVAYCALPRSKWPKLIELHNKLFGCGFEGAHDAGADIAATARCFWELVRLGVIVL